MNQKIIQQISLRRSALFFSFFVLLLILSGCKLTVDPKPDPLNSNLENYTTNFSKWQTQNINSYDFVFQRICFCTEDVTRPVEVSVQNKQKQSIRKIENYQEVDADKRDFYLSIDQIFSLIKSAIDENAKTIRVSYDAVYGFPKDVYIDYDERIADEELSILASHLNLAPDGVKPLPTSCEAYSTNSFEYSSQYGTTLQVFTEEADSVKVCVRSKHSNGCPEFVSVNSSFESGTFNLIKEIKVVPTLVACTLAITPYARLVELKVGGLEPAPYPINYYDSKDASTPTAKTSFELKSTNVSETISETYTTNLAKWQSKKLANYDFVFQRICFCSREDTRPALVSVQNNQKESIRWIETYQEVEANKRGIFLDVEQLFALIKSALDQNAKTIRVEYDATYGFPSNVTIDYDERIADDEVSIQASYLKVESEAGKPLPTTCEPYATDGYEYNVSNRVSANVANSDTSFATLQILTNQDAKAQVCVRSQHTNGCTDSIKIVSVFEKGTFKLVRTMDALPPIACAAVIAPYARLVDLEVSGLEPRIYPITYYASNTATNPQIQMTIDLNKTSFATCLPLGISDSTVVSAKMITNSNAQNIIEKITVVEVLQNINASCQNSKLLDNQSKEIRFYNLVGCWGALPNDADEQLARQAMEIATLKKDFTVIELTCNSSGLPLP